MTWCTSFLILILLSCNVYAANQTFYIDQPTGNNSDSCLTQALACETLAGAYAKATGDGNTFNVCNGTTHRITDALTITSSKTGTQNAPNVIQNFNCSSIRSSTQAPYYTNLKLLNSGWTQHADLGGGLKRWKVSHSINPYRIILQDRLKEGSSNKTYSCSYNKADKSTHSQYKNCWPVMLWSWGDVNGGGTNVNCPADITQRYEYCYSIADSAVYLVSPTSPELEYTNPGVEVLNKQVTSTAHMITIGSNTNYWTIKGINFVGSANKILQINGNNTGLMVEDLDLSFSIQTPITGNTSCSGCGTSLGAAPFVINVLTGEASNGFTANRITCHHAGRDCIDLSNEGDVNNATFNYTRIYASYSHGGMHLNHDNTVAPIGSRNNIVFNYAEFHDNCSNFNGNIGTTTFNHSYFHDSIASESDPRIFYDAPTHPQCGITDMTGARQTFNGTITINNSLFVNNPVGISLANTGGKFILNNNTIYGNTAGVSSEVNGGEIQMNANTVAFNGSGSASGSSYEIGAKVSGTGTIWSGGATTNTRNLVYRNNSNAFRHGGSAKDLSGWIASTNVTGHDSNSFSDPLFQDASQKDFNYQTGSNGLNTLVGSPACANSTQKEIGAFELATLPSASTLNNTTIQATACATVTPITVDCSKLHLCVNPPGGVCTAGISRTASNCQVLANGSSFTFNVSSPNIQPTDILKLTTDYGAIKTASQVGVTGAFTGNRLAFDSGGVTNTVTSGTDPAPTFNSCRIDDTPADTSACITFNPSVAGNMLPASGATGIFFDDNGVEKTISGTGTRVGVNEFCFTVTTAFVAGHTVRARASSSNITGPSGVALANFAYGSNTQCVNNVAAPPIAPTLINAQTTVVDASAIAVTIDPAGGTLQPDNDCTGFSVAGSLRFSGHTVIDCTRVLLNQYLIMVIPPFEYGEPTRQLCYEQGTSSPVTNGSAELAAGCLDITNNSPAPPSPGIVTAIHSRCHKAEIPGETFDGIGSAGVEDGACEVITNGRVHIREKFQVLGGDASEAGYLTWGCKTSCGTEDNWFLLTDSSCTTDAACLGADTQVTDLAETTQQLTSCSGTFIPGVYRKQGSSTFTPSLLLQNQCQEDVTVVQLSSMVTSGDSVYLCKRSPTGATIANCSPSDFSKAQRVNVITVRGTR